MLSFKEDRSESGVNLLVHVYDHPAGEVWYEEQHSGDARLSCSIDMVVPSQREEVLAELEPKGYSSVRETVKNDGTIRLDYKF